MKREVDAAGKKSFCQAYLRTMDPVRAAEEAGLQDGCALLRDRDVRAKLERLREDWNAQILREDAIRRLTELAFGRANDAAAMALAGPGGTADTEGLDLSAVSELKVTDKGIEVKFIDRVRALEALCSLLGSGGSGAAEFFQALEEAGEEADSA